MSTGMSPACATGVTSPRIVVAGATTAITRRTTLRKAFLAPWHALVPKVWLYALADAQRRTGVAIHHAISVVNHHHLTVTPQSDNLPSFTQLLHHDLSCALNTLLARERYDTPREVFDGRSAHHMRLLDDAAQASQLVYEHNNCVAAGLVSRPEHMPGHTFDFELWRTGYLDVERPPVYFSEGRPEHIRLYVTPPPLLFASFGGDLDWLIYQMRRASEDAGRTFRAFRRRQPLGARRVERLHPWSEPRTLREAGGTQIPTFRLGARGFLARQTAVSAAVETREFRSEYASARAARRGGNHDHLFPYGTYAMRVQHGAAVSASPKAGAIVTQPGPLLCDIEAELHAERLPRDRDSLRPHATDLIGALRNAIADECSELCEHADLDFDQGGPPVSSTAGTSLKQDDRPTLLVRHRIDLRAAGEGDASGARRMIVLRDRRRGRPPGSQTRHGADPP